MNRSASFCPMCRKNFEWHEMSSDYVIRNLVDKLEFSCKFNGCSRKIPSCVIKSHEERCEWATVKCKNKCGAEVIRRFLRDHKRQCPNVEKMCLFCSVKYTRASE